MFTVKDEPDGADLDVRKGLLDTVGEVNLRTVTLGYPHQTRDGTTYLVPRRGWNLLFGIVSTRADIDQIDSNLLYLLGKDLALFQTPREPSAVLVLFVSCPLRSINSDKEGLVGPRLTNPFDQPERPTHAVLQALTTKLVGPVIGDRGEE